MNNTPWSDPPADDPPADDPLAAATHLHWRAVVAQARERTADAEDLMRQASAVVERSPDATGLAAAGLCHRLARTLDELGLVVEAEVLHRRCGTILATLPTGGASDRQRIRCAHSLAANLRAQQRDEDAVHVLAAALTLAEGLLGPRDGETMVTSGRLAALYEHLGRSADAAALDARTLSRYDAVDGPGPPTP